MKRILQIKTLILSICAFFMLNAQDEVHITLRNHTDDTVSVLLTGTGSCEGHEFHETVKTTLAPEEHKPATTYVERSRHVCPEFFRLTHLSAVKNGQSVSLDISQIGPAQSVVFTDHEDVFKAEIQ